MTIDDLRRILAECAGEDESLSPDQDVLDVPFTELGYDSLALLETAARINQEYGIGLSDQELLELGTPRAVLARVSDALVAA